jgi:serralysin
MSTVSGGGGTGIQSSIAQITTYNPFTEGGPNDSIRYLLGQTKWGSGLGTGLTLTTSFGASQSTYSEPTSSWSVFTATQIGVARHAMGNVAAVCMLNFSEVSDTSTSAGDVRWGNGAYTAQPNPTAYAALPAELGRGGDIWFGNAYSSAWLHPTRGSYGWYVFLHELGHAIGLVHPQESQVTAKPGEDQLKYTIMSNRDFAGDPNTTLNSSFLPTTLMLNDIQALQYLYGANTTHAAGSTRYQWASTASVYETIWDAGGIDTIDASTQQQGVVLNLNSGAWSQIGVAFWNGQANVRDCLTIAYGCTIENADGSAYNDFLIGNTANNQLNGLGGHDSILGGTGHDTLFGGIGSDTLHGGAGQDVAVFSGARSSYAVSQIGSGVAPLTVSSTSSVDVDTLVDIERVSFSNVSLAFDTDGYVGQLFRLYRSALGREADAGGLGYYMKQMEQGASLLSIATNFTASPEFQSLYGANPTNEQYVTALYRNALGREPDPDGMAYQVNALNTGTSRAQLLVNFSESTESKSRNIIDADGNAAQLYRLYDTALNRAPDSAGLGYYMDAMTSGTSLQSIANNFMQSPEFQYLYGSNVSNGTFVNLLYQNTLNRAPDQAGYDYHMAALGNGMSRAQLMINFSESAEHRVQFVGVIRDWVEYVPA